MSYIESQSDFFMLRKTKKRVFFDLTRTQGKKKTIFDFDIQSLKEMLH